MLAAAADALVTEVVLLQRKLGPSKQPKLAAAMVAFRAMAYADFGDEIAAADVAAFPSAVVDQNGVATKPMILTSSSMVMVSSSSAWSSSTQQQ